MRKHILILAHSYGMQFLESCNQYAQLFDTQKYAVTVAYLVGAPDPDILKKTTAETVLFLDFSRAQIRGLKIKAITTLLKLCREKKFEIVICHRYKPSYIMLWVAQFCRIPVLFFIMHAIGTMQNLARRILITSLARKNMIFAGVSNAVRDDLRSSLATIPSDRIITLYNIIDPPSFEPQFISRETARKELQLSTDAFVFGHIGRFVKEKNQASLLLAFAAIKRNCPRAKLVMIGDGRLEAELKKQAHILNLENDIIFTGFLTDGFRYMKAFDVFVLCSTKEAFGRVLLEAMTAQIPLLATRTSGMPEVVGDSGFLVETKNPQALSDKMLELYQTSADELAAWGSNGYQRMQQHFSPKSFAKLFWEIDYLKTRDLHS
jgi:glycosyltransferase involved in cell wall biosynthesis